MKESIFIIVFGVFIYLGVATILGDSGLIGSYGEIFASYNHQYFGYISYVYLLLLLVPIYIFYRHTLFDFRRVEVTVASFLSLFASLLFQALVIQNESR